MNRNDKKADRRKRPTNSTPVAVTAEVDDAALQWVAQSLDTFVESESSASPTLAIRYLPGMTDYVQRWHELRLRKPFVVPLVESWSEKIALAFLVDHSPFGTYQVVGSEFDPPPSFTMESQQELFNQLHEERYIREPLPPKGKYLMLRVSHLNRLHELAGKESPFKTTRLKAALKRAYQKNKLTRGNVPGVDRSRRSYLPAPLDEASFQALIRTCTDDRISVRDKALMHFVRQVGTMGTSAIRLLQVQHLTRKSPGVMEIDLAASGIRPLNGRVRPLNPLLTDVAFDAMNSWLEMLDKLSGPVFTKALISKSETWQSNAITSQQVYVILRERSMLAGLPIVGFRSLPARGRDSGVPDASHPLPTGRHSAIEGDAGDGSRAASLEIFVVREKVPRVFPEFVSAQFGHFEVTGTLGTSPLLRLPGFDSAFDLGRIYLDGNLLVEHASGRAADLSPFGARVVAALAAYFGIFTAGDFHLATLDERLDRILSSPAGRSLREACAENDDFCAGEKTPLYAKLLSARKSRT